MRRGRTESTEHAGCVEIKHLERLNCATYGQRRHVIIVTGQFSNSPPVDGIVVQLHEPGWRIDRATDLR